MTAPVTDSPLGLVGHDLKGRSSFVQLGASAEVSFCQNKYHPSLKSLEITGFYPSGEALFSYLVVEAPPSLSLLIPRLFLDPLEGPASLGGPWVGEHVIPVLTVPFCASFGNKTVCSFRCGFCSPTKANPDTLSNSDLSLYRLILGSLSEKCNLQGQKHRHFISQ